MKTRTKVLNMAMSVLLTGSFLTACSPAANTPGATTPEISTGTETGTNNNATTNTGTNAGTNTGTNTGTNATTNTSSADKDELSNALQAVVADDSTFADASTATEDDFATQAIGIPRQGEVSATAFLSPLQKERLANATPEQRAKLKEQATRRFATVKAATRVRLEAQAAMRKEKAQKHKAALEANGALKVNDDGTIIVDPVKLKAYAKAELKGAREKFKAAKEQFKDRLQERKEIAQARVQKLRRKNQVVRSSEKETIENDDGSITEIITVEFKNERTGVMRTVTRSRTTMDGKLVSSFWTLETTGPNGYVRNAERTVDVAEDGTRTVTTEVTTTFPNGNTRTRSEERVIDAEGNATGSGVVTITMKDGTVKTFDYGVTVAASGETVVESQDGGFDVSVVDDGENTTLVVDDGNGGSEEADVDLSEDIDVSSDTVEDGESTESSEESAEDSSAEDEGAEA